MERDFNEAKTVFTGFVTEVKTSSAPKGPNANVSDTDGANNPKLPEELRYIKVKFELKEVFKGHVTNQNWIVSTNAYFGGCAPAVAAGLDYVFSVQSIDAELQQLLEEVFPGFLDGNELGAVTIFGTGNINLNSTAGKAGKERLAELRALSKGQ